MALHKYITPTVETCPSLNEIKARLMQCNNTGLYGQKPDWFAITIKESSRFQHRMLIS